jgi:hypothetical protein
MKQLVYDVEVFPNFFCVCFEEYSTGTKYYFEISPWKDTRNDLLRFIRGNILIGYNSNSYDNIILNYIISYSKRSNQDIYNMSKRVINGTYDDFKMYRYPIGYQSIDIMTMLFSKMQRVGLKELAVNVNFPKIQDLPKHFDDFVEQDEVEEIKKYCFNDVSITKYITELSKEKLNFRIEIEKEYKIKCLSKDDVNMGVALFQNFYTNDANDYTFLKKRTHRPSINLIDCISDKINFKSKQFNNLLEILKNKTITETKGALKYSVIYGGVKHDFGTGGLHSKDKSQIVEPKDDEVYMDCDVDSLYPSVLINEKAAPKHLDSNIFIKRYSWLKDVRLKAKKEKNMFISDTFKLSLNGTYGNLINEFSWLYDPKAAMKITMNGQLMLSMLSERLIDGGMRVDSVNTDGITAIVKKKDLEKYYSICKEWEKHTELSLSYDRYHKVFRMNVNSYIAWYADMETGEPLYDKNKRAIIKEKGFMLTEIKMGKGFDKPVVKKALREYFIYGKSIEEYIRNHDDIYDFCMMQKMDKKFIALHGDEILQKTNRFYASSSYSEPYLYKVDEQMNRHHLLKDSGVTIFNDYNKKEMKDYEINYDYYIREAKKIIYKLEIHQLELW